jgi:pimeloyl-ACP methyl ester carboxylesterase
MTPEHPSDPELQTVDLDSGPVAYTREGSGPALLALHGSPGNHRDFRWITPCLIDSFQVIRVDLPGMGSTPLKTHTAPDLDGRADFVARFLDALDIRSCTLVGHSMGAAVAMVAAERFPDRVDRLVLLAPPGLRPHRAFRKFSARRWHRIANTPVLRWLTAPLMRPAFRKAGFPRGISNAEMSNTLRFAAYLDFSRLESAIHGVDVPTFIAWAQDDRFIEVEIFRELSENTPNGPRMEFPDGGHNLQKTRAIEISDSLKSWILAPDQLVGR